MPRFSLLSRIIRCIVSALKGLTARVRPHLILGLSAGNDVRIAGATRIRAFDGGCISLDDRVNIERFVEITASRGSIFIGSDGFIGQGSIIVCNNLIHIGKDVLVAENVTIRDQNHIYGRALITRSAGFCSKPIIIGDNVWLGAKVTVLAGVTIGDGCVVGAGSVVTRDLPAYCVAAGAPARIIRSL